MDILKRIIEFVMDILETVTFVGSIFIVVYLFIMQPHQVRGHSMDDTFNNGDYILTSKVSYRFDEPKYGDIVVFKSPHNPDIDFIKRIIGVPGDSVIIQGGIVYRNAIALNETYTKTTTNVFEGGFVMEGQEITVPEGYLFVLGDNRSRSSDSREFGFVSKSEIIGKVFFRYYPVTHIGPVKNTLSDHAGETYVLLPKRIRINFP